MVRGTAVADEGLDGPWSAESARTAGAGDR
jgi:hypothetical protein